MKTIIMIIVSLITNLIFIFLLTKINHYDYICYIFGMLQMAIYLGILEVLR